MKPGHLPRAWEKKFIVSEERSEIIQILPKLDPAEVKRIIENMKRTIKEIKELKEVAPPPQPGGEMMLQMLEISSPRAPIQLRLSDPQPSEERGENK